MTLPHFRWGRLAILLLALTATGGGVHAALGGKYRLPGDVIPEKYVLKLVPYLELGNMRYTGTVAITVKAQNNATSIVLHAHKELVITKTSVRDLSSQELLQYQNTSYDADTEFLTFPVPVVSGNSYLVSLTFENKLQKDNYGFYISSYETPEGFEYMATTHFEATSARKAFPCFDEPMYRATFDISLAKLDDQIALSNMPVASVSSSYDPSIGNRRWVTFETTPRMPTYLVAFIVSRLKKVNTTDENINIYVRPGAEGMVTKAAEVAPKLLSALEEFLGVQYALPKLDIVAIPDFPAGAMENWGLITFKESSLLVTEGVSEASQEYSSLKVIAHEFTHLWFGDLVTLKWWNTIWQQEGMAAFLESYILDKATDKAYSAMGQFGTTRVHTALDSDALEHSPPLTKDDIESPASIRDHFGTITYSKGCGIHFMLLNVLGEAAYKKGLHTYLTSNEYTAATIDDFAAALQSVVNDKDHAYLRNTTIQDLVNSWGKKPGYPVLTVIRDYETRTAVVTQSRFLAHEPEDSTQKDSTWNVPFYINDVYSKIAPFTQILKEDEKETTITGLGTASSMLASNWEQAGFFRVNYDLRNWLLTSFRSSDYLEAATRAALIDDVYALNRAGHMDTWLALYYLQNALMDQDYSSERGVAPWLAAAKALRGYAALTRADKELATYFQRYTAMLVGDAFRGIGWENEYDKPSNSFSHSVVRDTVTQLACDAGMAECRKKAYAAYSMSQWNDETMVKDTNVLTATLCEGARYYSEFDFSEIIGRALITEDPTAKSSYLRAAGCVRDPDLIQSLLDIVTSDDSGLSASQVLVALKSVMDHSADGSKGVLTYITNNIDSVKSSLGQSGLESTLLEIARRIYSDEELQMIQTLSTSYPSDAMKDAVAVATGSLQWIRANAREMKEWVSVQLGVSPPRVPAYIEPAAPQPTSEPKPVEAPTHLTEWNLPDDLAPVAYVLDIVPYLEPDFKFEGKADITFNVNNDTSKIVLHAHADLVVDVNEVLAVADNSKLPVIDTKRDSEKEFLTINLGSSLQSGKQYTVSLSFSGPLSKDLAGLYVSSYTVNNTTKWMAATQFEQTSARKAFPCFDEPRFRTTFDITVARLDSQTALSNMPEDHTSQPDASIGGRVKVTFRQTLPMPTYLVAIIVSELKSVEIPEDPRIKLWVREGTEDQVEVAKRIAPKVLKTLEDLTGIPYPLPKLDLAAIPDFAPGAMENWGLITFKDTVLSIPPNSKAHRRFNCARDIAHEFSHLWFGDLVTNAWWSSLWQQEGMASFLEAWVLDQATNYEFDAVVRQGVDRIDDGFAADSLETAGPLTNYTVGSPDQINEHGASGITYDKGAGILRMMKAVLGDKTMWKGLRKYLSRNAYSTAGPDDLAAALQEAADEDNVIIVADLTMKAILDSWTLKKGFPVLDVTRYLYDDKYIIKQSRFLSYETADQEDSEDLWIVPFNCDQNYVSGLNQFDTFLTTSERETFIPLEVEGGISWIVCNQEQAGFYRVNYDISTWMYLASAVQENYLTSSVTRGALVDDALAMLRARRLEPWVALYVVQYAVPGDLSLPMWGAVSKNLNYLRAVLANDAAATQDLNTFIRDLTSDSFAALDWYNYWGWEESVQTNDARELVSRLACDAGDTICVAYANRDYNADQIVIRPETYGATLCTKYAEFYSYQLYSARNKLTSTDDPDQRSSIIYALGCVKETTARKSLLDYVLETEPAVFQSGELPTFFESLLSHGGEKEVLTFFSKYWPEVKNIYGTSRASQVLQMAAERVHSQEQYDMVKTLAESNPSLQMTVAQRSAAHALKFAEDELMQVKEFLAAHTGRAMPKPVHPSEPEDYRLPGDVVPENYELKIVPYIDPIESWFSGSVDITAKVKNPTNRIVLHSHKHLDVLPPTVTDLGNGMLLPVDSAVFDETSQKYTIHLKKSLEAGQRISIFMDFESKLKTDKLGFYISTYLENGLTKYIAATQFEQTYARKAFPCFDEPKYRATFNITVARTATQVALSNMPEMTTSEPDPDIEDRVWVTFETTPLMPTYLVAFIVSELQKVETSDPNINVYVRKDVVDQTSVAVEVAPKILAALEKFTGVKYNLPKLDLVAIPDFEFGAMENWGLVTFRETRMLYKKNFSNSEYKIFVAEIIAHEFTHLWFGDYVTLDWWSSGWLKEGMAEFLQYYILEEVMKSTYNEKWYPLSRLGVDDTFTGMRADALEYQDPLTDETVATPNQISEHMSGLTYTKGAAIHFMLMGVLGVKTFQAGLQNYLTRNALSTGTPEQYADALQDAADFDVAIPYNVSVIDLIRSWTTKPGLPVITVTRQYEEHTVKVSQARYLSLTPQSPAASESKWIVPLNIYYTNGIKPEKFNAVLMDNQKSTTIKLSGENIGGSIFANWLQNGYYYTNYDMISWIRITSALRNGYSYVADPMYRAGVIHDTFALARAEQVDLFLPLHILENSLPNEKNAAPWLAAYNGIRSYAALAKADKETDKLFHLYLKSVLMEKPYKKIGWMASSVDTDGNVARDYVTRLTCFARNSDCRSRALGVFTQYTSDPLNVDPDILPASLCEGLSLGSTLEFTNVIETLVEATDRSRRMTIIYGLGCIQNSTLLNTLIDLAGKLEGFEPQEILPLFQSILDNNPSGIDLVVTYLMNNFEYMAASLGQSSAEAIVLAVAEKVYTSNQYSILKTLVHNSKTANLQEAQKVAEANVRWVSRNIQNLRDYLLASLGQSPPLKPDPTPVPVVPPTQAPVNPTPGPGPTEPSGPADEWRLPSDVAPVHYVLEMVPYLEVDNFNFKGRIEIVVTASVDTDQITLHAKDLDIPNDTARVCDALTGDQLEISEISTDKIRDFLTITLNEKLMKGTNYNISLEFSAPLRTDNFGFYVSSYTDYGATKYMATTHFEATSARKAFPCFDEPRFRATFDISIARLSKQTALSNMPKLRTSDPDLALGGRVWDDFDTTPSMPTYLVAFIVHEMSKVTTTNKNINVWVRPDAYSDASVAAEIAPQAIAAMEAFTSVKLPIPKVDLVAIPTFPIGAMENWGLVTFREDYIINSKTDKSEHAFKCASVITHELSHLWFGDLVTIDWWSAAWLKEGMASLLELYILDKANDAKYSAYNRMTYEHVGAAFAADGRESADVLTNYTVGSPAEISDHMGTITYSKGASFLRMLMTFVGERAFKTGLSSYIQTNSYYWGTPAKLASALQTASDQLNPAKMRVTVQEMFDSWTTKPGYPVITLTRDRGNKLATVTQSRLLTHEPTEDYVSNATWHVPFNIWMEGENIPQQYSDVLLESQSEKTILLDDSDFKLVLINAEQTGFYRVNYDMLTWIYIFSRLPQGKIPSSIQRAVLIDDSFNLAMARQLESFVPLVVLQKALPTEDSLEAWMVSRDAIFRLRSLLSSDQHSLKLFDNFVNDLISNIYDDIDWSSQWSDLEKYTTKLLRDVIMQVACTVGNKLCKRSAGYDYEGFIFNTATVSPDTLSSALCEGMRTQTYWSFRAIWDSFLKVKDPAERAAYMYGFGCLTSEVDTVMNAATTFDGIKSSEAKIYYNSLFVHLNNAQGELLYYVESNYKHIKNSIGVKSAAALLQLIAERVITKQQFDTVSQLADEDPCIEMTVVKQTALRSLKWAQESLPVVKEFLAAQAGEVPTVPTPAPQPTAPPATSWRLSEDVVPQHYDLKVVPYLTGQKRGSFDGEVSITVTIKDMVFSFALHTDGLEFTEKDILITSEDGTSIKVNSLQWYSAYEYKRIFPDTPLFAGETYVIKIKYNGTFSNDLNGLFVSDSTTVATKLAPTYARRVFPCFDEPDFRATFTVSIGRLPTEIALSNTALESTSNPDASLDGRVIDTFKTTEKISTHSVSVIVSSALKSTSSSNKKITIYGSANVIKNANAALSTAAEILEDLETITGAKSGLEQLTLVGLKDMAVKATSNWGVDILRENALVKYDETLSAGEATIFSLTSVAHCVTKQWFGNLVGLNWWSNVWLTDGFATYFEYKTATSTNEYGSLLLYANTFGARVRTPALVADSMESSTPLNNTNVVGSTASIDLNINQISSLKGGFIVSTLPHIMGENAFENGLKNYFSKNLMTGATPDALYEALEAAVDSNTNLPQGTTLGTVLRSWVDLPGYPVVTVIRDYETDTATLTAERYLRHSPSSGANMTSPWWIPISFSTRYQYYDEWTYTPVKTWIEPGSSQKISLKQDTIDEWLVVNLDRKGFYRVNYDIQNWMLLIEYNNADLYDLIEIPTRLMLIDDALALARSGHLDYTIALQYVDYLRMEYLTHDVFEVARPAFASALETFLFESSPLESVYKVWVGQLLSHAVQYFGYEPLTYSGIRYQVAQGVVMEWACDLDIKDCTTKAEAEFTKWLKDVNSVSHDVIGSTVCAGVRSGSPSDFNAALANLAKENNDVYRRAIIRGLGCVANETLAESLLDLTGTHKVDLRDGEALEVFKSVTRFGPSKVNLALKYLDTSIMAVYVDSGMLPTQLILQLLAERVTTQDQYVKLLALIQIVGSTPQLEAGLLLAADNQKWAINYKGAVGDMLYLLSGVPNPDLPGPPTTAEPTSKPTSTFKPTVTSIPINPTSTVNPTVTAIPIVSTKPTTAKPTAPTVPTGPVPTDPPTRGTSEGVTWFTLPPSSKPTTVTLPPLPTRAPPTTAAPATSRPSVKPPTAAPPAGSTTAEPSGAASAVTSVTVLLATLVLVLQQVAWV